MLLLASLDKLTKEKDDEICDKINQLPESQEMVKDNNELSDKTDQFQLCIYSLKISKCALEETLHSSSHRAQVVKNQTKAFIIMPTEL